MCCEDVHIFLDLLENVKKGIVEPRRVRFVLDGESRWFKISYEIITNITGEPIIAIGRGIDIQHEINLIEKSNKDQLTQCYNKSFSEKSINKIILRSDETQNHAMFIIDIDDFKKSQ